MIRVQTKHDVGDKVWTLHKGKPVEGEIVEVRIFVSISSAEFSSFSSYGSRYDIGYYLIIPNHLRVIFSAHVFATKKACENFYKKFKS